MKLLFALVILLHVTPLFAAQRLPLSQRTAIPQKQASESSTSHTWKFSLLGLAALSFLIRKRL